MNRTACFLLLLLPALPAAAQSPYAGQETRELKALSAEDVAGYLEGKGMGFAKAAELNGLPGPMHVLELADGLGLTEAQRDATRGLMERHKAEARALGREYIEAERTLERLMASRADAAQVAAATAKAAELQGRVRASHLTTHVAQAALLDPAQVRKYAQLRGYTGGAAPAPAQGHSGHRH